MRAPATLALHACIHPKVVSERLGHATIAITLDTCAHAIPTMQEEVRIADLAFGDQVTPSGAACRRTRQHTTICGSVPRREQGIDVGVPVVVAVLRLGPAAAAGARLIDVEGNDVFAVAAEEQLHPVTRPCA